MFSSQMLISSLKRLAAKDENLPSLSHQQRLNHHARRVGFLNYEHYQKHLKNPPNNSLDNLSLRLVEYFCSTKLPSLNCPYYEFTPDRGSVIYYSYWIGYDKNGEEVRIPRPLEGRDSVMMLRKHQQHPVYVVESEQELLTWLFRWNSKAYIPEKLAHKFFPRCFNKHHLVERDFDREMVIKKSITRNGEDL